MSAGAPARTRRDASNAVEAVDAPGALDMPAASHVHIVSVVADPNIPVGTFAEPPLTNWQAMEQIQDAEQEYARRTVEETVRERWERFEA